MWGGPMKPLLRRSALRACFLSILLITAATTFAQTNGRILGQVNDPSGAVIPGVKVTLVNEQTGASRTAETSKGGDFVLPEVPVGTYRLEFEVKGFKKSVRRNILLQLNQVITAN